MPRDYEEKARLLVAMGDTLFRTRPMPQDYEYRIATVNKDDGAVSTSVTTTEPKEAGDLYRRWCKAISTADLDTVLQCRPVAPWETVESTKV